MNKLIIGVTLCLSLLTIPTVIAQESESDLCQERLDVAKRYLFSSRNYNIQLWIDLNNAVKNCVVTSNDEENYIKEIIRLRSTTAAATQIFDRTKAYADLGVADANYKLAMMYKYGYGTAQNFDKAYDIFQSLAAVGDQRAKFAVGYFHFKGLGKASQNYNTSYALFTSSTYSMAKHFKATSILYGYGTTANQNAARQQLLANKIPNSQTLALDLGGGIGIGTRNNSMTIEDQLNIDNESNTYSRNSNTNISGNWTGTISSYDYSGTRILKTIPVKVSFTQTSINNYGYSFTVGDRISNGTCRTSRSTVVFNNFFTVVERLIKDHPDHQTMSLAITNLQTSLFNSSEIRGQLSATIDEFKEPSNPMHLRLKKSNTGGGIGVSRTQAKDDFITVYPNPVTSEFSISFEQPKKGKAVVSIQDFYGLYHKVLSTGQKQTIGKQEFRINDPSLQPGMYVVNVTIDGTSYQKIIVKK